MIQPPSFIPARQLFEEIYETHGAVMYGSILSIVKDKSSAEKILFKAFIEIRAVLDTAESLTGSLWFIQCARRNALNYLLEKGRHRSYHRALRSGIKDLQTLIRQGRKV